MKPRNRAKDKGRRVSGSFTLIPHAVQDSANWRRCSGTGIKLVLDLARQYNGKNNGDLCAAMKTLRPCGWTRDQTVSQAAKEARHYGLLVLTRQGGLNRANLYALTWHPIDDCGGKLDCAATRVASGEWRMDRAPFKRPRRKKTPQRNAGEAA